MADDGPAPPLAALSPRRRLVLDLAMLALAIASLGLVIYEITSEATLTAEQRFMLDAVDLGIVLVFAGEFVYSARKSGQPWRYVRINWYDLPSMIWLPGAALGGFVGLRLLRFVRLIRVARAAARLHRISRHVQTPVLQERVLYIAIIALATILFGALSAFVLEKDVNPLFATLDDALWWALVTTATVGYGDIVPITAEGRLVAGVLMLVGVGIIGVFAGTMAQTLLTRREARKRRRIFSRWHNGPSRE